MLPYFHKLYAYDVWANRETLESLKKAVNPSPKSIEYMAHVVAGEWFWLGRLGHQNKPASVWPESGLSQCEAELPQLAQVWKDYLNGLTPERLNERIAYINTKGESWSNTIQDILMHVLMHSAYHRAQIASNLRAAGHQPAYTDFIHSVRQGFVK
jgi:uncharacterized damage-inducible protein DinB